MDQLLAERTFSKPQKKIEKVEDTKLFPKTIAYHEILDLITHISRLVSFKKIPETSHDQSTLKIVGILDHFRALIDETPPQEGPRRFGNVAFRTWLTKVETAVNETTLTKDLYGDNSAKTPSVELNYYLLNSFGSNQRLDYGTGHELSFLAFTGGLYMLGMFKEPSGESWLLVFSKYFDLVRSLITVYNLEPAGSHGVWGLDDHFHLAYIFGAAQLIDISTSDVSAFDISPKDVLNKDKVLKLSKENLYFGAIQFIYELKKGPFHEHSPILFDVSGVPNWQKVFKGMSKMYDAEVLNKFPVVQHFYFGKGLYPWVSYDGSALSGAADSDSSSS